jgi:hypothetical protein
MNMERFIKVWIQKKYFVTETIAFILIKACCLTSVHWSGTSLDVRHVSGARNSDCLGHMSHMTYVQVLLIDTPDINHLFSMMQNWFLI